MANCLYLHESNITKFDFVNHAFAKLVVGSIYFANISTNILMHLILYATSDWTSKFCNSMSCDILSEIV